MNGFLSSVLFIVILFGDVFHWVYSKHPFPLCRQTNIGVLSGDDGISAKWLNDEWNRLKKSDTALHDFFVFDLPQTPSLTYHQLTQIYQEIGTKEIQYLVGGYSPAFKVSSDAHRIIYFITNDYDNSLKYQSPPKISTKTQVSLENKGIKPFFSKGEPANNMVVMQVRMEHSFLMAVLLHLKISSIAFLYDSCALDFIANLIENTTISVKLFKLSYSDSLKNTLLSIKKSRISTILVMIQNSFIEKMLVVSKKIGLMNKDYTWIISDLSLKEETFDEYLETRTRFITFKIQANNVGKFRNMHATSLDQTMALESLLVLNHMLEKQTKCTKYNLTNTMEKIKQVKTTGCTGELIFDNNAERQGYILEAHLRASLRTFLLAEWNSSNGELSIRSNVRQGFTSHLSSIKVTSLLDNPFLMYKPNFQKFHGNARFQGYVVDLLLLMSRRTNLTFDIILTQDGKHGYKDSEGNWNGMVGDLLEGKATMAISSLTLNSERNEVIDFTIPFTSSKISALGMVRSSKAFTIKFTDPFSTRVWLITVVVLFVFTFIFYFIDRCIPSYEEITKPSQEIPTPIYWRRLKTNKKNEENSLEIHNSHSTTISSLDNNNKTFRETIKSFQQKKEDEKSSKSTFIDVFCKTFSTLLLYNNNHNLTETPRTTLTSTFLTVGLRFCALILIVMYASKMAAIMTTNTLQSQKGSLEELMLQKEARVGTVLRSEISYLIEHSSQPLYKHLWQVLYNKETSGSTEMYSIHQQTVSDVVETQQAGIDRIKTSPSKKYYFLWHNQGNRYQASIDSGCELENVESQLTSTYFSIGLTKNSTLKTLFDSVLLELAEDGSLSKIEEKWWGNNGCLDANLQVLMPYKKLLINDFAATFGVLVVVVVISLGVCFIEYRIVKRKKDRLDKTNKVAARESEDRLEEIQVDDNCLAYKYPQLSPALISRQTQIF